jgi:hypothetical protein
VPSFPFRGALRSCGSARCCRCCQLRGATVGVVVDLGLVLRGADERKECAQKVAAANVVKEARVDEQPVSGPRVAEHAAHGQQQRQALGRGPRRRRRRRLPTRCRRHRRSARSKQLEERAGVDKCTAAAGKKEREKKTWVTGSEHDLHDQWQQQASDSNHGVRTSSTARPRLAWWHRA